MQTISKASPLISGACHTLAVARVEFLLSSSSAIGLDSNAVQQRQRLYGANSLELQRRRSWPAMLVAQFSDFMIVALMVAAIISGVVGELRDALAIIVILILNAGMGFIQELRAERSLTVLRKLAAPNAHVLRNGNVLAIAADEIVPGDVVLLEAGNVVPADLRISTAEQLQIDEASLTGESQAVAKTTHQLNDSELDLGDRTNMAYKGTVVMQGRGRGLVVAIGMDTELGRIAKLLAVTTTQRTPLQLRMAKFGQRLSMAVLLLCGTLFVLGAVRGESMLLMFMTAVSLAVAAIPEALPAVVTVSLALGARKMARMNALVRHLPAVETLGSVTYICADKTGTLTENKMRVESVWLDGSLAPLTAYKPQGGVIDPNVMLATPYAALSIALALSNDVECGTDGMMHGDPTEVALYAAAAQGGVEKTVWAERLPRIGELVFDAQRKRMTTLHRTGTTFVSITKGAPETMIPQCDTLLSAKGLIPFDGAELSAVVHALAEQGGRVLAFALKRWSVLPSPLAEGQIESGLILIGLVALVDPPRVEVPAAVASCKQAGIVPVMITGDHPATALAIARRIGIAEMHDLVLTGVEMARLTTEQLQERVAQVHVYARVTPEQKIMLVKALQARGQFVAMTGDGVNDAPALKCADIGIAMGRGGTDVAREAAQLVLLDDNFATIVGAVHEGRRIYENIRKFVCFNMTGNLALMSIVIVAPLLGLPLPLLPAHILWINMITDGLPGLAFALEPAEKNLMVRAPRPPGESIFAHGLWQHVIWAGALIGAMSLAMQLWLVSAGDVHWQTMLFTSLTLMQLAHVLAIRSQRESLFTLGLNSNRPLLLVVLGIAGLQLGTIYLPVLQEIFKTQALSLDELLICFALALFVFIAIEIEKWVLRRGGLFPRSE